MDATTAKEISLFQNLSPSELEAVVSILRRVEIEKDTEVIHQGQPHQSLYLVEKGVLHVRRKAGRSQILLGRIEKGGFFGEVSLFDPGTATASIRSMDKVLLWEIRKEDFDAFLREHPATGCTILRAMMVEMAKRLRRVDQRLTDAVFWGAEIKS